MGSCCVANSSKTSNELAILLKTIENNVKVDYEENFSPENL